MSILITGASGFVGGYLLARNSEFVGVDINPRNPSIIYCDVNKIEELRKIVKDFKVKRIVHLAGVQFTSYIPPTLRNKVMKENLTMAQAISSVAESENIEVIVYVSTDMVYGSVVNSPVSEVSIPKPIGEYGESKLAAEKEFLRLSGRCKVVIFRPRLIMGQGRQGTIQTLSRLLVSRLPLFLIGNGKSRYQFVGVEDVCEAILLALETEDSQVYNLGSDNPPQLNDLFKFVLKKLGIKKLIVRIPSWLATLILSTFDKFGVSPLTPEQYKIAGKDYVLDTTKVKERLKWTPKSTDGELLLESLDHLI